MNVVYLHFCSSYFYDGTKVIPKMYLSELLLDLFLISVQYVYKDIVHKKIILVQNK